MTIKNEKYIFNQIKVLLRPKLTFFEQITFINSWNCRLSELYFKAKICLCELPVNIFWFFCLHLVMYYDETILWCHVHWTSQKCFKFALEAKRVCTKAAGPNCICVSSFIYFLLPLHTLFYSGAILCTKICWNQMAPLHFPYGLVKTLNFVLKHL